MGIATPTEAAGVAIFIAFILALFVYRVRPRELKEALIEAATINGMVMLIMIAAYFYSFMVATSGLGMALVDLIRSLELNPWVVIFAINLSLLFMGCFMDAVTILVVTVPVFVPLIRVLGFDPLWFGIIMTINVEIAFLTPPFGFNLFTMMGIWREPLGELVRSEMPFLAVLILLLVIVSLFPQLALWLPSMMG